MENCQKIIQLPFFIMDGASRISISNNISEPTCLGKIFKHTAVTLISIFISPIFGPIRVVTNFALLVIGGLCDLFTCNKDTRIKLIERSEYIGIGLLQSIPLLGLPIAYLTDLSIAKCLNKESFLARTEQEQNS